MDTKLLKPHRGNSLFYKRRKKSCGKIWKKEKGLALFDIKNVGTGTCRLLSAQIGKEKTEK
jgi:hypothetical protein